MIRKTIDWGVGILDNNVGLRFFLSGGTAGVADLIALYFLHNIFGFYYLLSAIVAFILAFGVSFTLHKFWTFKSHEEETHRQIVSYFMTSLFGLFLNTTLMYVFVDYFHINVLLSQVIVGLLVACVSFFISRNIVFKYKQKTTIV
ncbi:MAG: GtrA family protein [Minisyncoccia bacterium]